MVCLFLQALSPRNFESLEGLLCGLTESPGFESEQGHNRRFLVRLMAKENKSVLQQLLILISPSRISSTMVNDGQTIVIDAVCDAEKFERNPPDDFWENPPNVPAYKKQ